MNVSVLTGAANEQVQEKEEKGPLGQHPESLSVKTHFDSFFPPQHLIANVCFVYYKDAKVIIIK